LDRTDVRNTKLSEIGQLARIWYDGWHEAHAQIVPAELVRLRTLQSFTERLRAALTNVWVTGSADAPVGFYILRGAELYQLFVSIHARSSGAAAKLIADAEARLGKSGVRRAWLACAIGNDRAARFYEKHGWFRTGSVTDHVEIPAGTFALQVWRYEKLLEDWADAQKH